MPALNPTHREPAKSPGSRTRCVSWVLVGTTAGFSGVCHTRPGHAWARVPGTVPCLAEGVERMHGVAPLDSSAQSLVGAITAPCPAATGKQLVGAWSRLPASWLLNGQTTRSLSPALWWFAARTVDGGVTSSSRPRGTGPAWSPVPLGPQSPGDGFPPSHPGPHTADRRDGRAGYGACSASRWRPRAPTCRAGPGRPRPSHRRRGPGSGRRTPRSRRDPRHPR
jgi:hypothetical protein